MCGQFGERPPGRPARRNRDPRSLPQRQRRRQHGAARLSPFISDSHLRPRVLRPGRWRRCRGCPGADDLISGTAASCVTARDEEGRRGSAVTSGSGKAGEDGLRGAQGCGGRSQARAGRGAARVPVRCSLRNACRRGASRGAEGAPQGCSALWEGNADPSTRVFPVGRGPLGGRGAKARSQGSRGAWAEPS